MAAAVRLRFAPSPTGRLHVGNAYVALANWLFARKAGGSFVLRLDDTDRERSDPAFAAAIEEDLRWLGLAWDLFARQSERAAVYDRAVERLKSAGRLYPCYETPEELELKRKRRLERGLPPVYDREALALDDVERARLEVAGRHPHWRFLLRPGAVEWHDLVRGRQRVDQASQSDPVLLRADGSFLYTLPSVADDIDLAVSHVVRGSDHVTNTGAQIQLFEALGGPAPAFGHLPLLLDASGAELSKRQGAASLAELRRSGIEPMAVAACLARLGTGDPAEPIARLDDLLARFDLVKFGRASPRFDPKELRRLNARLLHRLTFEGVADELAALGLGGVDRSLWDAARGNVETLADLRLWHEVCGGAVRPAIEDAGFTATAARLLPPEPWDAGVWEVWTKTLSTATGRTGRELFRPLRLALTGRERGPEMRNLLPLIGRERALARLAGNTA